MSRLPPRIADIVVAVLFLGGVAESLPRLAAAGDGFAFEVRETAGIRRRYDVVTARLPLARIDRNADGFQLLHNGAPVQAQFRRVEHAGSTPQLVIDFIDHFDPLETRQYVLMAAATGEECAKENQSGLQLIETPDSYDVSSSGVVFWKIRKDLSGLLDFAWKETDYIAENSAGLFFETADGERTLLGERRPDRVFVERAGPIACSLHFEYEDWPPGARSRVCLEFVRTKSWIHGLWTIEGSPEHPAAMGGELNLRLDGTEALLDFGAGDFVYATVTREQAARLEAGPREGEGVPWRVLHGPRDELVPIVVQPPQYPTPRVYGWAHVMDEARCTALAVGRFGEETADAIAVDGSGRLTWLRHLRPDSGRAPSSGTCGSVSREEQPAGTTASSLEFWLHFVTMPVHIGARTSPRSMQEPLQVHWLP